MADMKQKKHGAQGAGPKQASTSAIVKPGTGSGSRPNAGSIKIKTSAPEHPHHLGKTPKGALK